MQETEIFERLEYFCTGGQVVLVIDRVSSKGTTVTFDLERPI